MEDFALYDFLEKHKDEDIRIYTEYMPEIDSIKIQMYRGTAVVSRAIDYQDLILFTAYSYREIFEDMYTQFSGFEKGDSH